MKTYALVTRWQLRAPIERVWDALSKPEDWPRWWRYVKGVKEIEKGDARGVGALRRYTWSTRLPYDLSFNMRTTAIVRPTYMEGIAQGELNGKGVWRLAESGDATSVQYEWTVTTDKPWMNLFAPLLAPVFAWNHNQVMEEGARGIARHLGVELIGFEKCDR